MEIPKDSVSVPFSECCIVNWLKSNGVNSICPDIESSLKYSLSVYHGTVEHCLVWGTIYITKEK
jgi:hypothetical protein